MPRNPTDYLPSPPDKTNQSLLKTRILRIVLSLSAAAASFLPASAAGDCPACDDCLPRVALKTNMLHDAALIPDLGIELSVGRRFSLSLEGGCAWWNSDSRHRTWRLRGALAEMRVWLGHRPLSRALTGHHVALYGAVFDYDFEFGHKGWQTPEANFSVGLGYGYSFRIAPRLNLDLGLRLGYVEGKVTEYVPQCGGYVCTDRKVRRYFGPTGIDVTLVWFPGKKHINRPDFTL